MQFFSSDTHFGHANIIRYSKRPYIQAGDETPDGKAWTSKFHARDAARRMDEDLIRRWNETVTPDDDVSHCGDFSLSRESISYLRKLNFRNLNFVWGNHDSNMSDLYHNLSFYPDLKDRVHFLGDLAELDIEDQKIVLCHYAMRVWDKSHAGTWHLYGHSHGSLPDDPTSLSFDVGVDCHDYRPISFKRVKEIMAKKIYVPIDHHGARPHDTGVGLSREDYQLALRKQQYEMLKKEFNV
jgi:calcineurin-like phosphoesterase family protein